jgi:hypothetical protein
MEITLTPASARLTKPQVHIQPLSTRKDVNCFTPVSEVQIVRALAAGAPITACLF